MCGKVVVPGAVLVGALLIALPARGAEPEARATGAEGAATPLAAWQGARTAYGRRDFGAYFDAIAPDAHDECLCDVTYLLAEAFGNGVLGTPEHYKELHYKELNEILRRHKVAEVWPDREPPADGDAPGLFGKRSIHAIPDKAGVFVEVMRWLASHGIGPRVPAWLAADLSDVTTTGITATATASGGIMKTIHFEKVGETWKIKLPPLCLNDLFR
jgi:hypothetical protein